MIKAEERTLVSPALLVFNTLRPRQDGRHFADDIFMCIFLNENCCILIKFSLVYVRKGPTDNDPALVEIMAWRRSGNKPLSKPMMIALPTHICVTRPQWVNIAVILIPSKTNMLALLQMKKKAYVHSWCNYVMFTKSGARLFTRRKMKEYWFYSVNRWFNLHQALSWLYIHVLII